MDDNRNPMSSTPATSAPAPAAAVSKPKAKPKARRTAPRKPSAAAKVAVKRPVPARKPAASKSKPASAARKPSPGGLEAMLASFSKSASRAGASVSSLSSDSVRSAKRAWNKAGVASKSTVKRVLKEWRDLDPKRRASYVAALVGALAAASAPIVRSKLKSS